MIAVRYVLPGVIFLAGVLALILGDTLTGLEGLAMGIGVAGSVLLLNVLYRVGVKGDLERDDEEAARVLLRRARPLARRGGARRAPPARHAITLRGRSSSAPGSDRPAPAAHVVDRGSCRCPSRRPCP